MKIMAVLAVLLAAALFIGAASAAYTSVVNEDVVVIGDTISLTGVSGAGTLYPVDTANKIIAGTNLTVAADNSVDLTKADAGTYIYSATTQSIGDSLTPAAATPRIYTVSVQVATDAVSQILNGSATDVPFIVTISNATTTVAVKGLELEFSDGQTVPVSVTNVASAGKISALGSITPTATGTITVSAVASGSGKTVATTTLTSVDARTIKTGETAFVYEYIFTVTGDSTLTLSTQNSGVVNTITGKNGIFNLLESAVGGHYGEYNSTTGIKVNIWYPELSLLAYLGDSTDSVDGKTVGKLDDVSFYVEAPKVATSLNPNAEITIWFTTPVSGKTSVYGTTDFAAGTGQNTILTDAKQLIGTANATADAAAGTYTAYAEFQTPKAFKDYAKKSNTISFTVQSSSLTITAAKDSVVRSNPFTVTISGDAKTQYKVYITNPEDDSKKNPTLQPGQSGFKSSITNGGIFETDASGKRTIQFNTAAETEDKTFTIRVERDSDDSDWDEVKVKVEKGAVTISAEGDGSYYIGAEIKLTGTNTDSSNIYLFITGPNLKTNGEQVKQLPEHIDAFVSRTADVAVKTDNTWEYKWNTANCGLDTGAYTIYATSQLTNGKASDAYVVGTNVQAVKLSDSEYATISVNLKQPFLSAIPSGTVVAKGDKIYIRGTAEGEPNTLQLYIFGPNKYQRESITVEDDGTYEKKLEIGSEWSSNQYFVVIEHPMYNGQIDVKQVYYTKDNVVAETKEESSYTTLEIENFGNKTTTGLQASFIVEGTNKLQGSNAADALTKMIDSANIDDIYTKLTFTVAEPWINIKNPGDQATGSKFTITGTTNLAVDDQILVEVVSSSFNAIDKTSTSTTSGVSQTTKVVAGEGTENTWSVDVDTTNWKLDEYTIKVSGIEVDVSTTTNFNLVEKLPDTPKPTETGATVVPTTATATATATPSTPGFGAFIALAGLGAVALLVLRRN
ncbi:PGF-CTERM sorting domain-containing protein [Methanocorpusculum sp. MG]|uniref:PGF-CTERM sorting domain-containing protein n=1 Tax=Methanocorpusculum petauri TaxID=3002863 RepID=A0ABT4IHR7_9EURY|nr:MEMAR_RS02690 family S-layer glycoprotein [Methanocorpusculum petauri]MCZ0861281.1 PGF-CTERM sorting domain-containing protein [Methanocorpusculum petauri]